VDSLVFSLLVVQICTGVALVATVVILLAGLARRPRRREPARVVATNPPARGTQFAWVLGTLVAVFWGIGVFVVPAFAYHWPAFPDFPGSSGVQVAGMVLTITGGFLFSRAAQTLGREMTPAIQVAQDHQLVQTGPYRYVRHPIYTAVLLVATGGTLFFLSLPLGLLALLLLGLAVYRARLEETLLASPEAFGATYRSYIGRTGRFLPRLRSPP
jgi:protein-S-isoprenylcysteine O-methyltransferase Ste14